MKYIGKIVIFIVGILGCFSCSNPYELEDQICDCYTDELKKVGEDYHMLLTEIEDYYIKEGVLASAKGESYKKAISKLLEDATSLPVPHGTDKIRNNFTILFNPEIAVECILNNASLDNPDSKYSKLSDRFGEMASSNTINISSIFGILDESLTAEDFEHPIYKWQFLSIYYGIMDFNTELLLKDLNEFQTPEASEPFADREQDKLKIFMDAQDRIWVNGYLANLEGVRDTITAFYKTNNDTKNTNPGYPFYEKVDTTICNVKIEQLSTEENGHAYESKVEKWNKHKEICNQLAEGSFNMISPKAYIQLTCSKQTGYQSYIDLQDVLKQTINTIRNEMSEELGWGNYLELDDSDEDINKKEILRILIPERIVETQLGD